MNNMDSKKKYMERACYGIFYRNLLHFVFDLMQLRGASMDIIFDVGGVLLNWNPRAELQKLFPNADVQQMILDKVVRNGLWKNFDAGKINSRELVDEASSVTSIPEATLHRMLLLFRDSMTPKDGTISLVRQLREEGHSLYVLSNMPREMADFLMEKYSFWEVFSGIVFSGHIGKIKPDVAIYEYIIEKYELKPGEAVFIDDMDENLPNAETAGLRTIQFTDAASCREALHNLIGSQA